MNRDAAKLTPSFIGIQTFSTLTPYAGRDGGCGSTRHVSNGVARQTSNHIFQEHFPMCRAPIELERNLGRELDEPWIACLRYPAKIRPSRNVAVRIQELRVIKDVEELDAEFPDIVLLDLRSLNHREIPVVHARSGKHVMTCVADLAQRLHDKGIGVEIQVGL